MMTPGRQPLAVGADGDVKAFVERRNTCDAFRAANLGVSLARRDNDPAEPIFRDLTGASREQQCAWWADVEFTSVRVELDWPSPARRPIRW